MVAVGADEDRARLDRIGVVHHLGLGRHCRERSRLACTVVAGARARRRPTGREAVAGAGRSGAVGCVAVWGGPGAPGRTTVASAARGRAWPAAGREVVLIDGDAWAASVAQLLGLDESPSVTQAARLAGDGWPAADRRAACSPARRAVPCWSGSPVGALARGARAVRGGRCSTRHVNVRTSSIVDLAAPIEEDEDLVVDRSPYRRNLMTVQALREADDVLLVSAGDPIGLRRGIVAHRTLSSTRGPTSLAARRVVVNRRPTTPRRLQDCSTQVAEWTGRPPLAFLPTEPAFDRVVWEGRPLHDIAPRSPWLRELRGLVGAAGAMSTTELPDRRPSRSSSATSGSCSPAASSRSTRTGRSTRSSTRSSPTTATAISTADCRRSTSTTSSCCATASSGSAPLTPLLEDPEVEEIWINEPGSGLRRPQRRARAHRPSSSSPAEVEELVERMLARAGRRLDRAQPFVDARLPDGSRLHVVIPPITRPLVGQRPQVRRAAGPLAAPSSSTSARARRAAARFLDASVARRACRSSSPARSAPGRPRC